MIAGIAVAMKAFSDETVRKARGKAAKALVRSTCIWSFKAAFYAELHSKAVTLQKESSPQR